MKRTPLQTTEAEPVRPSTRDPIAQWLDVFTSLLALPASEADRIRDELEDHLRTRVDDLLILGMTEPEAIQKAVTELGETAQLARNFRSVRTHSRRRIAMHTALFAVVGLALSVSIAGFLPGTPGALPGPVAVVQPEESGPETLGVDLEGGTLEGMLSTIAEATGARLFVHWQAIEGFSGLTRETEVGAIPSKNLDGAKVRQLLNSMLGLEGDGELTVRTEGDLMEVATRAYFDAIETVTVDYDVSKLVPAKHVLDFTSEGQRLKENLEIIVEPDCWLDNGGQSTLTFSGSVLTVRAPKRIQEMVGQYIAKLEHAERERGERAAKAENEARSKEIEFHARSLASSEETLARHEAQLVALMTELDTVNVQRWKNEIRISELRANHNDAQGDEAREKALEAVASTGAEMDSLIVRGGILRDKITATQESIQNTQDQIAYFRALAEGRESAAR